MAKDQPKTISRRRLYEIICNSHGGQWITFTAVTRPVMVSPWRNLFWKVAVVRVKIKCNYTRCVNAQRSREGKRANFNSGPLPWGEWDINFPNSPFIRQGNKLYLRVHVHRVHESYFFSNSGEPIPRQKIEPFLRKRKNENSRQRLRHPVKVRTYLFDGIRRITVSGQHLRRKGRYLIEN